MVFEHGHPSKAVLQLIHPSKCTLYNYVGDWSSMALKQETFILSAPDKLAKVVFFSSQGVDGQMTAFSGKFS